MKKQAHSSPCFGLKRVANMYKGQRYSAGRTEWCENLPTCAKDSTTCWFYGLVATSFSLSGHQGVYFTQHVSAQRLSRNPQTEMHLWIAGMLDGAMKLLWFQLNQVSALGYILVFCRINSVPVLSRKQGIIILLLLLFGSSGDQS